MCEIFPIGVPTFRSIISDLLTFLCVIRHFIDDSAEAL